MKVTIKGFIHYRNPRSWEEGHHGFSFIEVDDVTTCGYVKVQAHSFEVEVPDNFDPRPQQVKSLEAKREQLRADFSARCTEIDRQISELTCLEMSPRDEVTS